MQTERAIELYTPLGKDILLFKTMLAKESLGKPFVFKIDVFSQQENIDLDQLLGKNISVELEQPAGGYRYFNGFVTDFAQKSYTSSSITTNFYAYYELIVQPWLWFLSRTSDCRIFQDKKVIDIVKDIFSEYGFTDFEDKLANDYPIRDYCVQYRETDLTFISRIMEQEGIYYFFKHEKSRHILILSDDYSAHKTYTDYESIPFFPPDEMAHRERDHLSQWSYSKSIKTGHFALNDFDFKKPRADLNVKQSTIRQHAYADFELYDYPGHYMQMDDSDTKSSDGDQYAKVQMQAQHARQSLSSGEGNTRGLKLGYLFNLTDYPRNDQNKEYLIISSEHTLKNNIYESSDEDRNEGESCWCQLEVIDSSETFRTLRETPKAIVRGVQTATVVGKKGEEIWTDKYGRVKVQFHWDRYGESDENSSCWVRVSQLWAGENWGGIHIPRIGQEVLVDFLEGDPDKPIITGRVYNEDRMPPYKLPDRQTKSGIKSRSSKGGNSSNFNEFRFDDKKGEEQIFIHAERDLDIRTKQTRREYIGNNRHLKVMSLQRDYVHKDRYTTINENDLYEVVKSSHLTIGEELVQKIGRSKHETIGSNLHQSVGTSSYHTSGMNVNIIAGKSIVIDAGMELTISAGGNFIKIDPSGITIQGTLVRINSGGSPGKGKDASPKSPTQPEEPKDADDGKQRID